MDTPECPILTLKNEESTQCLGKKCAWYFADEGCAISATLSKLKKLDEKLEQIKIKQQQLFIKLI